MLKFNAGRVEKRMATLIGFGFEEENLKRLVEGDPIHIKSSDIKLDQGDFLVFYAGNDSEEDFKKHFSNLLTSHSDFPLDNLQVVHNTDEHFFVVPLAVDSKTKFVIGLTDQCMNSMRNKITLTYRMRIVEGKGENYEVIMFWGKTADEMAEQFSSITG